MLTLERHLQVEAMHTVGYQKRLERPPEKGGAQSEHVSDWCGVPQHRPDTPSQRPDTEACQADVESEQSRMA